MKQLLTSAACTFLLLSTLTASAQGTAPAATDPDAKEVQSYQLTEEGLKKFVAASRELAIATKADPRYRESQKLKKEMEALQEKEEPTRADEQRMEALTEQMEKLENEGPAGEASMSDAKSLSEMAAAIERQPAMAKALAKAGMTPREYAKFTLAFFQAAMVHGMQKSGMVKEVPKELQAQINMENVKFVAEHQEQLAAMQKEFQAMEKEP